MHATDPAVRGELLGRKGDSDVLERIDFLVKHNIQMHAQVVLCPSLNDGAHLKQTIFDLAERHPHIESVGVVPLGLTRFRKNLPELAPVTPEISRACIEQVTSWQAQFSRRLGTRFVYLGDEFFLQAGQPIPPAIEYDGFPLVENGIGMVRRFLNGFEGRVAELDSDRFSGTKVALVTGMLGPQFLQDMVGQIHRLSGPTVRLVPVSNRFLGEGITVSGLLTGQDILEAFSFSQPEPDEYMILPPNCVNHNGLLLDDFSPEDLAQKLGCSVRVGTYDLVETLLSLVNGKLPQEDVSDSVSHPYIRSHQVSS